MFVAYDENLKHLARNLCKNMTDVERLLWSKIRKKQISGLQFYRQKRIGSYIVDFCCPKAKLVIELDGSQHYRRNGQEKDKNRDAYLKELGSTVLRFSNRDIFENLEDVLNILFNRIESSVLPRENATDSKGSPKMPIRMATSPFEKGGQEGDFPA
jgi:very-short-patch-repair endonuclease